MPLMENFVKRSILIEMISAAMLTAAVAGCSSANRPGTSPCPPVGRYQITASQHGVYLLDTTNGHVWLHDQNTSTGWGDMPSPSSP